MIDSVYLDHNATTPIHPEVLEAMQTCYQSHPGNAASPHSLGRQSRAILEGAREQIAEMLGARLTGSRPDRLLFTSGGTESNNLALKGMAGLADSRIIVSAIEHPSVRLAADELSRRGTDVVWLPVDPSGIVSTDGLADLCTSGTCLISVMLGNNETGILQPVREIVERNAAGVSVHTDAVQVVGKLNVHFRDLGVSALSFSAHKFHGPMGIGGLLVRHDVALQPQLHGGAQQMRLRPGTEPVALAVGMCKALELWHADPAGNAQRLSGLRDRFESQLRNQLPWIVVHGRDQPRLPHTSNISFPGLDRQALLIALDLAGVACSTGSACTSGSSEPSPVLIAMGCSEELFGSSLRFSLGMGSGAQEVDLATSRICNVANELRNGLRTGKSPSRSRGAASKRL